MKSKYLFLILLSVLILVTFINADVTQCTPDNGYTHCAEQSYSDNGVTAHAKMQTSDIIGTFKGGYYIGSAKIKYKGTGDRFWVATNDNSYQCNNYGKCIPNTIEVDSENELTVDPGYYYTDCPVFIAWACNPGGDCGNQDSTNPWAWTEVSYGWFGSGNCINIKVVNCYDNSDCSNGQVCDNSNSDWGQWKCTTPNNSCRVQDELCGVGYTGDCCSGLSCVANSQGINSCQPQPVPPINWWLIIILGIIIIAVFAAIIFFIVKLILKARR